MSIDDLRERAEQRVVKATTDISSMTPGEIKRLVYELEVHQEELEIQNEELRRVQLELVAANDRYADLYDFAPVGYLTIDGDDRIFKSNLSAATLLGHDRVKVVGSSLAAYCDQDSRAILREHLHRVRTDNASHYCELRIVFPDGRFRDVRLDSSRVTGDDREYCRLIITDITVRKQAEELLAKKNQHLRSIADALPVLIGYIDTNRYIKFCNAAHYAWFGIQVDEMQDRNFCDVVGNESAEQMEAFLTDALSGRRIEFELQMTHRIRGLRHVQMMFIPDRTASGTVNGIHSLGIDVSDRKVVEQQNARHRSLSEQLVLLTSDEIEVYKLLIRGRSNKTIAAELDIGLRTAERRRHVILEKLGVQSVAELIQKLADIQGIRPTATENPKY